MKDLLRKLLSERAPAFLSTYRGFRNRLRDKSAFEEINRAVKRAVYPKRARPVVASGPFKGMVYLDETLWGPITPKWLGCYEAELHAVIEAIIKINYTRIINIGSAEGYYAVGLAKRCPSAEVFAFDIDSWSRRQCRKLARLNHVDRRVVVAGNCPPVVLCDTIRRGETVIVCDIEGGEAILLDPLSVPDLSCCDLLVEVHEGSRESHEIEMLLNGRFSSTHDITRICAGDRPGRLTQQSDLDGRLGQYLTARATDEKRGDGFVWLWLTRQ